jgi:class 3 adenylate cyclase
MNSELFKNRLTNITEKKPEWAVTILKIKDWVEDVDVIKKNRINPYQVATDISSPLRVVVGVLLHGVKESLFRLHWDIHCPHCNMITTEESSLSKTSGDSYCKMCDVKFLSDFSTRVEVSFSLHPEIDIIDLPPFCGPPPKLEVYAALDVPQGQTVQTEVELVPGKYRYFCPITTSKGILTIEGEPSIDMQVMKLNQLNESKYDHSFYRLRPGKIQVSVTNQSDVPSGLFITTDDLKEELNPEDYGHRLSGLELIHFPEFQELFGEEKLSEREKMTISGVAILFTDITGSTKMYEELGDIKAYNIVRDHFDILSETIQKNGGTLIKTIGDAVMASFLRAADAMETVFSVKKQFDAYNAPKSTKEQIHLKIGIHSGPAILVNLNDRIDYFGTTVNKAARVQSLAQENHFCISEDVWETEGIKQILKANHVRRVNRKKRELKGLLGKHPIYFIPLVHLEPN